MQTTTKNKILSTLTDEQLMTDVSNGNLDAMTHIFERYHKRIFNFYFQMLPDKDACEDMVQSVFYKAIRYRTSYKGGKFVSWIFKIARNVFSDHYQKQKKTTNNYDLETVAEVLDNDATTQTDNVEHLKRVLQQLSPEERELVILNRLQGVKYNALAEITGVSEGAIKVKMHRIIKKLKTIYFKTV